MNITSQRNENNFFRLGQSIFFSLGWDLDLQPTAVRLTYNNLTLGMGLNIESDNLWIFKILFLLEKKNIFDTFGRTLFVCIYIYIYIYKIYIYIYIYIYVYIKTQSSTKSVKDIFFLYICNFRDNVLGLRIKKIAAA